MAKWTRHERALFQHLLSLGGERVAEVPEEDAAKILARGEVEHGENAISMPGAPSACHRNTANLWEANKRRVKIMTGWALSSDGIWRSHSWGRTKDGVVVETTVRRVLYFGFVLTAKEAETFWWEQY